MHTKDKEREKKKNRQCLTSVDLPHSRVEENLHVCQYMEYRALMPKVVVADVETLSD